MKGSKLLLLILCALNIAIVTSCKNVHSSKIHMEGIVDSLNGVEVRITNIDFSIIYDSTVVRNANEHGKSKGRPASADQVKKLPV